LLSSSDKRDGLKTQALSDNEQIRKKSSATHRGPQRHAARDWGV
jgi:hypothetical protein